MQYAVLFHPGHNRVYFETSLQLAEAEFAIVAQGFSVPCEKAERKEICGVPYLTFFTEVPLSKEEIDLLFGLSFIYALFELKEEAGECSLKPLARPSESFIDESISVILKYTGKTNELFTRMMLNLAVNSLEKKSKKICMLDPVAGKGTTLYEGLVRGYNVYGIEIGDRVTAEAHHYLKRFLENAKYKFSFRSIRLSGENKAFKAERNTFEIAKTKEDAKTGNIHIAEFVCGNSMYADQIYKKNFFDILVGDLPYGVQHGNVTNEKQTSLTRDPSQLLAVCLPAWRKVLKPGGAVVLAWNSNVLPRKKMEALFEKNGLLVKNEGAYLKFEHRVDQSIKRDILVAVKPSGK